MTLRLEKPLAGKSTQVNEVAQRGAVATLHSPEEVLREVSRRLCVLENCDDQAW